MTNREILNRIKKCFTNFRFPGGYEELALTNKDAFESLISDLLRDAHREEQFEKTRKNYMKYYSMSTYGKDASIITGGCHINTLANMTVGERIKMLESLRTTEVDDYFIKHYQINDEKITKKACVVVRAKEEPKPQVMFNKPVTIFKCGDFKTVVKCDEEDKFDVDIGLGIALYRFYRQNKSTRKHFNKLAEYMDLEQLADYALDYFCDFSKKKRNGLFNDDPVNGWYRLDK